MWLSTCLRLQRSIQLVVASFFEALIIAGFRPSCPPLVVNRYLSCKSAADCLLLIVVVNRELIAPPGQVVSHLTCPKFPFSHGCRAGVCVEWPSLAYVTKVTVHCESNAELTDSHKVILRVRVRSASLPAVRCTTVQADDSSLNQKSRWCAVADHTSSVVGGQCMC